MARIVEAQQGSPEWHKHRAEHYNASDAPAMFGVSSYKTRADLQHEKKTGVVPEVDPRTQKRFDQGHEYEAMARPWAEEIVETDLYPVVLAAEIDGLPLSASFDGLTMDDSTAFEHKTLNATLRECIDNGDELPEEYRVQMEQQLLISGAARCLFMASAGERSEMRYCWYYADKQLRNRLLNGWSRFDADLATYEPPAAEKVVTGSAPSALPALRIELSGAVTESNLDEYRDRAIAVFDNINTDLQTDQDFADAEETVKFCKDIEKRLEAGKENALSQTADIDQLFRTIDEVMDRARKTRLNLDKQVKAMKEQRKAEIFTAARDNYAAHCVALEQEFAGAPWSVRMPDVNPDIAGAMKGKRTIATLRDAAETEVANAKIEADRIAREIRASIDALKSEAEGYESMFPDGGQLVTSKSPDDVRNLAKARIAEHQEQERQRAEREAEQQRIREEQQAERARQQAEANAKRDQQREAAQAAHEDAEDAKAEEARSHGIDTRAANMAKKVAVTPERPTDDQIIACIADAFSVDHATARDWIAGMDMVGAEA